MAELCETTPQNESTMSFVLALVFVCFLGVDAAANVWSLVAYIRRKAECLDSVRATTGGVSNSESSARPALLSQYQYTAVRGA
jgi:hypothetical protein